MSKFYDIAISYAHEQEDYVKDVVNYLKNRNLNIFFDKDETVELWGTNLYEHLKLIYTEQSKYCVIFLSDDYLHKKWTSYEGNFLFNKMILDLNNNETTVLPVKFDDTLMSKIPFSIECLNAIEWTPIDLAKQILKKIQIPLSITYSVDELYTLIKKELEMYLILKFKGKDIGIQASEELCEYTFIKMGEVFFYISLQLCKIPIKRLCLYIGRNKPKCLTDLCSAEYYYSGKQLYCINYSLSRTNVGKCFKTTTSEILTTLKQKINLIREEYYYD